MLIKFFFSFVAKPCALRFQYQANRSDLLKMKLFGTEKKERKEDEAEENKIENVHRSVTLNRMDT